MKRVFDRDHGSVGGPVGERGVDLGERRAGAQLVLPVGRQLPYGGLAEGLPRPLKRDPHGFEG